MRQLDPSKLSVEYRVPITATNPIIPRRYTLTHSDKTGELFLTIGLEYAYDKTNSMRDEVYGEWIKISDNYIFNVYVYLNGESNPSETTIRNNIFRRELPLALEAIRYGDDALFELYPYLDNAPIIVYFLSANPQYNTIEMWGTFSEYIIE